MSLDPTPGVRFSEVVGFLRGFFGFCEVTADQLLCFTGPLGSQYRGRSLMKCTRHFESVVDSSEFVRCFSGK